VATKAEKLAELQAELVDIKAARKEASVYASFSVPGGLTAAFRNPAELSARRTQIEKSIQRLLRGGRGMPVDMSQAANGGNDANPYRSGSEVLL